MVNCDAYHITSPTPDGKGAERYVSTIHSSSCFLYSNIISLPATTTTTTTSFIIIINSLIMITCSCMQKLLIQANVSPSQVGYLNAHATSTQIGDKAEMLAISRLFQQCQQFLRISSTKGATGHLLGAAGVLEAGICAMVLAKVLLKISFAIRMIENVIMRRE